MFQLISEYIVSLTGLSGNAAKALNFWIYDSLKISFILFLVIFGVGFLRTYVKPEKIRDYLKGKRSILGYFAAAILGIISPFCSCSTIPLFLGFLGAGVPFGMTLTFLFVSPMVNEASVVVLGGVLGWRITLLYVLGGVLIGVLGGYSLNKLGFEKYVKDFDIGDQSYSEEEVSFKERGKMAYREAKEIVRSVIPYVLIGVGIGALVHGYIPREVISSYLTGSFAVPAAVAVGVPIYTNVLGVIPVVESLIGKGLPIGTSIAFMMSVSALSLPQFVILKKVMKRRLIVTYALMISFGIIILGLAFNFLLV